MTDIAYGLLGLFLASAITNIVQFVSYSGLADRFNNVRNSYDEMVQKWRAVRENLREVQGERDKWRRMCSTYEAVEQGRKERESARMVQTSGSLARIKRQQQLRAMEDTYKGPVYNDDARNFAEFNARYSQTSEGVKVEFQPVDPIHHSVSPSCSSSHSHTSYDSSSSCDSSSSSSSDSGSCSSSCD